MNWIIPPFEVEIGEFERVATTFNIDLPELLSLFATGTVEEMDDEMWSLLENTDSWDTVTLEQVFETAARYERNAHMLLEAFNESKPMQTPIVLFFSDGRMHLVSGNTRLMICRATGRRPKVLKLHSTF